MWCIIASFSPAEVFNNKLLISSNNCSWLFVCKNGHTVAVVRASPKLSEYRQKHESRLPSKVFFHQRSSSIKGFFHQRSSSTKGCLSLKVVIHQRSSSIEGYLPLNVSYLEFLARATSLYKSLVSVCVSQILCVTNFKTSDWIRHQLLAVVLAMSPRS